MKRVQAVSQNKVMRMLRKTKQKLNENTYEMQTIYIRWIWHFEELLQKEKIQTTQESVKKKELDSYETY